VITQCKKAEDRDQRNPGDSSGGPSTTPRELSPSNEDQAVSHLSHYTEFCLPVRDIGSHHRPGVKAVSLDELREISRVS
jgi:hypothetical protein